MPSAAPSEHRPATDPAAALGQAFRASIAARTGLPDTACDPQIRPSGNPQFGDFQANFAMALAKQLGTNPRQLATDVLAATDLSGLADRAEVAGPGFINIHLSGSALAAALDAMDTSALGVVPQVATHAVTIDLCGVNVAKQMHVGHLRATIIGDTLARVHERLGRKVWRENHLGDWGLPIAMTLAALRRAGTDLGSLTLEHLNAAYRAAQLEGRDDAAGLVAARGTHAGPHRIAELEAQNAGAAMAQEDARTTLVRLQSGDAELVAAWRRLIECTMREVFETAETLGVHLTAEHSRGESYFREELGPTVEAFVKAGLGVEDDGAIVVRYADRERPMLIRKRDGGFLYATTDLAACRFRVQALKSDRVVYVVDARQRDHFKDVFDAVRMIGWHRLPDGTEAQLVHLPFGSVLGADKKPLKTRSGENFTLKALLEEAIERGTREVRARSANPDAPTAGMSDADLAAIGRAVGIAAVKYADLGTDVTRDYVFDLDRMVSFEGDTGPYLQYAHARIAGILGKALDAAAHARPRPRIVVNEPAERQLALALLRYPQVVCDVAEHLEPSRLCAYLHGLATTFNGFYQHCPVLRCEDAEVRASRLRLCAISKHVLKDGLGLLGITAPERM
ncbi:MAG: arginine--tRNA ligase [Phycisphaerales bacterium]|nr:arginine--tRNA ligase [Phycisphaerales bacterium]